MKLLILAKNMCEAEEFAKGEEFDFIHVPRDMFDKTKLPLHVLDGWEQGRQPMMVKKIRENLASGSFNVVEKDIQDHVPPPKKKRNKVNVDHDVTEEDFK